MPHPTIFWVTVTAGAIGVVICLFDAWRWNRRGPQTLTRFFLLDGELRLGGFTSTIVAANLSLGNFLVFVATWGYLYGLSGLFWFIVNLALNVVGFLYFLPKFKDYIESRKNNGTIHDYLAGSYAPGQNIPIARYIKYSASLVTVTCLILAIVFELSLAVDLLGPRTTLERFQLFAALAFLIALFTAYGGFRSLMVSDIINSLIMVAGLIVLAGVMIALWRPGLPPPITFSLSRSSMAAVGWPAALSIVVIGTGWLLVAMDQWQRACASRSCEVTRNGVLIYFGIVAAFAVGFAFWGGFAANTLPAILGGEAEGLAGAANPLLDILRLPLEGGWGPFLTGIIVASLVFAAVSTTNTFMSVCSHSLISDVLVGMLTRKEIAEVRERQSEPYVLLAKLLIVGLVIVLILLYASLLWSDLLRDPLSFFYITYSVQFALLAPMVMSVSKRRRPGPGWVLGSLWLGFAVSGGLGLISWSMIQSGQEKIAFLTPVEWLTLTPVVTFVIGMLPLLFGLRRRA